VISQPVEGQRLTEEGFKVSLEETSRLRFDHLRAKVGRMEFVTTVANQDIGKGNVHTKRGTVIPLSLEMETSHHHRPINLECRSLMTIPGGKPRILRYAGKASSIMPYWIRDAKCRSLGDDYSRRTLNFLLAANRTKIPLLEDHIRQD